MKQRIYIDTSVIGGYFDEEFSFYTRLFFEHVEQEKFILIVSDILTELNGAPDEVIAFYQSISNHHLQPVKQNEESIFLAEQYLKEGVVGKTSRTDCRHILLATLENADILVS